MEEGVIKYHQHWEPGPSVETSQVARLESWRERLFREGMIGAYKNGLGYGNLSIRDESGFIITGTQTGRLPRLNPAQYTRVLRWDIAGNAVWCRGPVRASSEALSHAACYTLSPDIRAVFHVHDRELWKKLMNKWPTTPETVLYGTPAMAEAIMACWESADGPLPFPLVMAGHEEGILVPGRNCDEAGNILLDAKRAMSDSAD